MTTKVLSLFGGPRKRGNTATVLGCIEEELRNKGHEVDRVDVADLSIGFPHVEIERIFVLRSIYV